MMNIPINSILLSISFQFEFYPLLIVIGLAFLIPILLSLLNLGRIPTVIVEIILGYMVGKFLFPVLPDFNTEYLDFLALSGFMFLMFLGGLEIDVNGIVQSFPRKQLTKKTFVQNPLLVGFLYFLMSLLLSLGFAELLSFFININNSLYFALIMVTTSVGIILPVLKSHNMLNSSFGQMVITAAALADILSILLFSFTAYILKHGFESKLLLILGLFLLFYILYGMGQRLTKKTFVKRISHQLSHASSQIQIRGTIFLILLFIVIAQFIGTEVMLLGAFLAGLLISVFMNKNRSILLIKLDGMGYGFFIPVFFIMVGVQFDDTALLKMGNSPLLFLFLLLIAMYLIKILPALLWRKRYGTKRAMAGGVLMASRLSLIIAASKIGLDFGIISPGINAAFVLMAVLTCLISPIVFNSVISKNILSGDKHIIIGGSSTGVLLARRLKMHGAKAILIEQDKQRYKNLNKKGLTVINADGTDPSIFFELDLSPDNYIVVLTNSEQRNIEICRMLKTTFNHDKIISKASENLIEQQLKNLKVDYVDSHRIMATTLENLIFRPTTYHALVETFENYQVEDIKLSNPDISGRQVKDVPFHKDGQLILIRQEQKVDIPHGNTLLKKGDIITVMGTEPALQDFRKKFKG
ncbi:MAG: monovalent cation:proton antiporter family protein [Bacteroidota bacterium]|nr:monovalent cation:proton antiporter family protein [Bacteroidota bacterium]